MKKIGDKFALLKIIVIFAALLVVTSRVKIRKKALLVAGEIEV